MVEFIQSATFSRWLTRLKDRRAKALIQARLDRWALGNPGHMKALGGGLYEMKIDHGPGYRVYWVQRGPVVVLLACGGDKSTQSSDIAKARRIAAQWPE
jgi:putative addiction module killer protein